MIVIIKLQYLNGGVDRDLTDFLALISKWKVEFALKIFQSIAKIMT